MAVLNVNGKTVQANADPRTPLLWVLRDTLGMTGTKYGCGIAQCGACTVHVDGVAMRSCGVTVSEAALLLIVPAVLLTVTLNCAPLSELLVAGVESQRLCALAHQQQVFLR